MAMVSVMAVVISLGRLFPLLQEKRYKLKHPKINKINQWV
jgi:hypothetical protein